MLGKLISLAAAPGVYLWLPPRRRSRCREGGDRVVRGDRRSEAMLPEVYPLDGTLSGSDNCNAAQPTHLKKRSGEVQATDF